MANTLKNVNTGSTVPGYGAVPPLTVGHVYTTNTTSGQFLTSTGSNGMSWTNTTSIADSVMVARNNPAELEVKGRVVINGKDLEERLDTIEKVLQIPERDVKLEKKHPKLKKLYDEYIKELSKYRMWESLKGDDDGTT
jgi:vancomycin resistance protein YoaR